MFSALLNLVLGNLLYFALHVEGSGAFPKPLGAKQEKECFDRMGAGDNCARDMLIEHNLRLVAHIAKKYYSVTNEQDDLISIGTIGLIKAVSTFDYTKGTRFATYASRCIEKAYRTLRPCTKQKNGSVPEKTSRPAASLLTVGRQCAQQLYFLLLWAVEPAHIICGRSGMHQRNLLLQRS